MFYNFATPEMGHVRSPTFTPSTLRITVANEIVSGIDLIEEVVGDGSVAEKAIGLPIMRGFFCIEATKLPGMQE